MREADWRSMGQDNGEPAKGQTALNFTYLRVTGHYAINSCSPSLFRRHVWGLCWKEAQVPPGTHLQVPGLSFPTTPVNLPGIHFWVPPIAPRSLGTGHQSPLTPSSQCLFTQPYFLLPKPSSLLFLFPIPCVCACVCMGVHVEQRYLLV